MIAQNFKTASDLGISESHIAALAKVLGMLERGEFTHHTESTKKTAYKFNMNFWGPVSEHSKVNCGTPHCIGGWAEVIGRVSFGPDRSAELDELFYPGRVLKEIYGEFDYERITTAQAGIAVRNYLTYGEPRWAEALAD